MAQDQGLSFCLLTGLVPLYVPPTSVPLPHPDRPNILVTSALPYVNNEPHLGNIIGCVLSADAYARYSRLRGYNTLYVSGTDEYGTATETKAIEEKVSCQALCDKYHVLHASIYKLFDIQFDYFGRTTTPHQTKIAQRIFTQLNDNKYLLTQDMTQLYCTQCSRFLADRFVEGTCPQCGFADARGDQCDACANLLNASELINPRCKLDGNRPVQKSSTHMFLNLPDLEHDLTQFIDTYSSLGKWSSNSIAVTRAWLKEGLKPRCITRDLNWGTPVPLAGFEKKVFYVWFDAPIGYVSITANLTDAWERWWKNPANVQLYQFMGKDNIPFHTVIFPSSLLGTRENWTMLHHLSTTEYLTYEGGKFSKSRKQGIFGSNVRDTGIDISVWRYYLFANRPESQDSDFSWKEMIVRNNTELLNNFGNFVNRVLKFMAAKYDRTIPAYEFGSDVEFIKDVNQLLAQYHECMENVKLRAGLQVVLSISARGNLYLQENKLDNALFDGHRDRCNTVLGHALNLLYMLAPLVQPFMPDTCRQLLQQLNAPLPLLTDTFVPGLAPNHRLGTPKYLFTRIDPARAEEFRVKYSGRAADEPEKPKAAGKRGKKPAAKDPIKILASVPQELVSSRALELAGEVNEHAARVKLMKADSNTDPALVQVQVSALLKFKNDLLDELNLIMSNGSH